MGTSPGFAPWFDRVSLSNAAGQDNRRCSSGCQLRLPPFEFAADKNVSGEKDLMSLRWQGRRT